MSDTPGATPDARWQRLLPWVLATAAFANAFWFTHVVANPMIGADNWLFVETFLRPALEGRVDIGDFLVKRAGFDHGQPFNKLLMLLNARLFGLDFSVEAMVGMVFAVLGFVVLCRLAVADTRPQERNLAFGLCLAAAAAVHVSLNTSMIYTFSLITLSHVDYFFAFLTFLTGWNALQGGRKWPFALAMLVYGIIGDKSGTLTGVVLGMTLVYFAWRQGQVRRVLPLLAIIVAALLASAWVYTTFGEIRGTTQAVFNVSSSERIAGLLAQAGDAWKWVIIPAASGVAYIQSLQYFFGAQWQPVQMVLGLVVVAAHVWFWWQAWRLPPRAASFAAICLMLLFYAYGAGLLYGRVFVRGAEFFDQPRYVSVYQLGIMALMFMAAARALVVGGTVRRHSLAVAAAVLLMVVQVPLTRDAYVEAGHIAGYYQRMAAQYGQLARDTASERECVDMLSICGMTAPERARTMEMLRRHRLNLFSPRFQRAHPELATAAGPLPD